VQALSNMEGKAENAGNAGTAASGIAKEIVREMVQQSSRQLAALGALS
jgi:hypothetical protein